MKGSLILDRMPPEAGPEREDYILSSVERLQAILCWYPITIETANHTATVFVTCDALRLGQQGNSFRPNVNAATAQRIADLFGAFLPTPKILDQTRLAALVLAEPQIQPADPEDRFAQGYSPSMSDTEAMARHSKEVDDALITGMAETIDHPFMAPLISNVGKHWVISNELATKPFGTAANYGWYTEAGPSLSPGGLRLIQPLSFRHNDQHVDYSQVLRLVHPVAYLDGQRTTLKGIGSDPETAGLISYEGVITVWRQPSVPDPAAPAPPEPGRPPPLEYKRLLLLTTPHLQGDDVRHWQQFLVWAGYDLGRYGTEQNGIDGDFGPTTDQRTRDYQDSATDPVTGNLRVDGKVGQATIRAANNEMGYGTAPQPDPSAYAFGIDVAHHQDPTAIDYEKLATDEGATFVIMRATYGTFKDGWKYTPPRNTRGHWERADRAGLTLGLYHFYRTNESVDAQLCAFMEVAAEVGYGPGHIVPAIDVERDPPTTDQVESWWEPDLREFAQKLEAAFQAKPLIYITQRDYKRLGRPAWLLEHPLWVAHWTADPAPATPENLPWTIWQYAVRRVSPTVYGDVLDLNRAVDLPLIGA